LSIQRIKIAVCLCPLGFYLHRWCANICSCYYWILCASDIGLWWDTLCCELLCIPNIKLLLLYDILVIMDLRNEILRKCYVLLVVSCLDPICQSKVHKLGRHLNLHSNHAGHVYLEHGYIPWFNQRRFTWLIQLK
jgi:hypothetical protein